MNGNYPNSEEESFWASKTMQLIAFAFSVILLLVAIGVIVEVFFKVQVFEVVGAAIAAVTTLAGGGTYRNYKVDGPIRMAQAGVSASAYAPPPKPDVNVEQAGDINT